MTNRRTSVLLSAAALIAGCLGGSGTTAAAFPNTQPDAAQQWYLTEDNAWNAWSVRPTLQTVKVAVIDSGIDAGDPAFAGRIAAGRSFVGGSWATDTTGHGTFVAGLIAANAFDGTGIAGLAFNAKLIIAKVVLDSDGVIPLTAEAAAIRWAVSEGARVINLSFGATRDPNDPELNSYSALERAAIEYAYAKGVVVVAAAGNGTNTPTEPWPYAGYPAALPNVIGVAALNEDGSVPNFSNRDARYVDIAAPGAGIFSTIPRNLEDTSVPGCAGNPYSSCGPAEFQRGDGTSFAAPQVSAAAALLLGTDPKLAPDQVDWILERSATDMTPANGCGGCSVGRDSLTGWGRVDVARAIAFVRDHIALPPPDLLEPDDDAGAEAHALGPLPQTLTTSEDYWDDPVDVFSLELHAGEHLVASAAAAPSTSLALALWKPGTQTLEGAPTTSRLATDTPGSRPVLSYPVSTTGVYYLEVSDLTPNRARSIYQLTVAANARVVAAG